MPIDPLKIPIRSTTQDHLDIEDILDDVVILKDGSATLVLSITALNFGLLSEKEQDAMIYAYAALLNSLTFPIQIIVRSRRTDISSYIKLIDQAAQSQNNAQVTGQIKKYKEFIQGLVKENNVLDKKFYVTIPFSSLELGVTSNMANPLARRRFLPIPKEAVLERAKMSLYPKRDHLIRQFARIGLKVRQLTTQELIQLFYDWYNPDSYGTHLVASQEYTTAMVQPSVIGGKPPTATPTPPPPQPTPEIPKNSGVETWSATEPETPIPPVTPSNTPEPQDINPMPTTPPTSQPVTQTVPPTSPIPTPPVAQVVVAQNPNISTNQNQG